MNKQFPSHIGLAALAVVPFLVFRWTYGYVIGFQGETNDCFFLFGRPFLLEFLDHPAGPLRYAGRFLGQFYHYQWLGALIVSTCITCFGVLFHRVLVKLDGVVPVSKTLLPCGFLLALHMSTLCLVQDTLGLCAGCGAFLGYLSFRGKLGRRVYALLVTAVVYLLLGVHVWFFVAWIVAYEWFDGPRRSGLSFNIGYIVFSIAVPLVAWRWVFGISLRAAFMCPVLMNPPFRTGSATLSGADFVEDGILAIVLSGLLLLIPFWDRLFSGTGLAAFWCAKPGTRSRVALAVALPALAILVHWIRYDAPLATAVACHRLYKQRQWDALLEKAKGNSFGDFRLQFMTNFALHQKGRLLDEMFAYPQVWGTRGLIFNFSGTQMDPAEDDTGVAMYNSDLFYEMGHVNAAFRHAYNSMTVRDETYDTLARMAQCSIVNGNYETAEKYLNILETTLFHRGFARRQKAIIADPDAVKREFGDLRRRLPVDDGHVFGPPFLPLLLLLDAKPDNRMAADYLMAWLLLDKAESSIKSICCPEGIEQLKIAGYSSMPTHCQEALLLCDRVDRTPIDRQGYRCDAATVARAGEFFRDLEPYLGRGGAPEHARDLYGDTYLFYHFFVVTHGEAQRTRNAGRGFVGSLREE